jgi:type VI protein secretion system component VasK
MLGDAVLYAASRATHTAIENVSRRLTWAAIAAVFLLAALILCLVALYIVLEPRFGSLHTVGIIAGGCAFVGIVSLAMPWLIERAEARKRNQGSPAAKAVATVDDEAKGAVDYFGALQVVGTAFLFGLGAARRLRG